MWPLKNLTIEGSEPGLDTLFAQSDIAATI